MGEPYYGVNTYDVYTGKGRGRVYYWDGDDWLLRGNGDEFLATLYNDPYDDQYSSYLGSSISLNKDGSILVISAPYLHGTGWRPQILANFKIYIWENETWNIIQKINISGTRDYGHSLHMNSHGNKFIISETSSGTGQIQIYESV